MASNNLRVIYNNLADTATITVSSTASATTVAANLKSDYKSVVWRSAAGTSAAIIAQLSSPSVVRGIVLGFNNLTTAATVRVRGYSAQPTFSGGTITGGTSNGMDSGLVIANPPANLGTFNLGGNTVLGTSAYEIRRGYARIWLPAGISCAFIGIEIVDSGNTDNYIEVSRLIFGDYWSPQYNTSFGLSSTLNDTSTSERNEAGDIITNNGTQYNTVSFDMKYMSPADRTDFNKLIRTKGSRYPVFISLFPDNAEDYGKEQLHQVFGKLTKISGISHPIFNMYATQVDIEEI
jgi:hypothetical protein